MYGMPNIDDKCLIMNMSAKNNNYFSKREISGDNDSTIVEFPYYVQNYIISL